MHPKADVGSPPAGGGEASVTVRLSFTRRGRLVRFVVACPVTGSEEAFREVTCAFSRLMWWTDRLHFPPAHGLEPKQSPSTALWLVGASAFTSE